MKKDIIRQNLFLNLLVVGFILVIVANVSVFKGIKHLASQIEETKQNQVKLKKAKKIIAGFDEQSVSAEELELNQRVPPEATLPVDVMREVVKICWNLEINDVVLSAREASSEFPLSLGGAELLPIKADVVCKYEDLLKFLDHLSSAETFINIEGLNVRRNPDKLPKLEAEILLNGFTLSGR